MLLTQSQQKNVGAAAYQMAPMMNMMKYVFPVMIIWMGRSFPAGLALYWFISTLIQVGQTIVFNKWKKRLAMQAG
jgi:YidC/Oxa1 family membrane protein insertase